jgi:hypothetical protein
MVIQRLQLKAVPQYRNRIYPISIYLPNGIPSTKATKTSVQDVVDTSIEQPTPKSFSTVRQRTQ